MGYSYQMLLDVLKLDLPKRAAIMDLGSQDIVFSSPDEILDLSKKVPEFSFDRDIHDITYPLYVDIGKIFTHLGYRYTCCDVDGRPDTLYIDFNEYKFPKNLKGTIDLTANCGTTEHLSNPVGAFALMHYVTKIGGVLFHDVPISGFGNHGLINLTPKFWHQLLWINSYKLLVAEIRDCASIGSQNYDGEHLSYITGREFTIRGHAMMRFVVRKTSERLFIPPFDAVLPESDGETNAKLIKGSLYPFIKTGVYTEDEVNRDINKFMKMIGKPFRYKGQLRSV